MQHAKKVPRILMGQTPNVNESDMFRVLIDVFPYDDQGMSMPYDYIEVMTGNDVVVQCMESLNHRNLFDLIVLSEYSGTADNMRISKEDTVKMIRVMGAYQDTPIVLVDYNYFGNIYGRAGITTWIHRHASHDEFVDAILASIQREMSGEIPAQFKGENWTLVAKEPQE